ncbi:MAG: hypothetical protein ABH864_00830 [archaeon]
MKQKQKPLKLTILIILGLIIIFNILGLVVETLFTLGVMQTDVAQIRTLQPISTIVSLAFIIAAIIFWINLKKETKKTFMWWNTLVVIGLVAIFYKRIDPTALTVLVPSYFATMSILWLIIWAALFNYMKKFKAKVVTSQSSH